MSNKGYSTDFIENLKSRCDIVSELSKHIALQRKGKTYWACCPFHHEKTPSFAVNEVEQFYHCYGCGESGDVIKFIQKYENLSFVESVKLLAENNGIPLPELEDTSKDIEALKQKERILKTLNLAMNYYKNNLNSPASNLANSYLQTRKITSETANYFNIGFSSDWVGLVNYLKQNNISLSIARQAGVVEVNDNGSPYDFFGNRLIFPILNGFGDCIGFTARTLEKDAKFAKYKNSSQSLVFDKSKTIYNIHTIKQLKKSQSIDYIIICEGTIDVIAMVQAGFKNTVACLGTALTNLHAKELKRYTNKILLCLDGDSAGQNAMYKAIDVLFDEGLEVKVVKLKDNLDPDEYIKTYGTEEMQKALDTSLDAVQYKLESLSNKFNLLDSYQKSKYIKQALEIIDNLEGNSQKEIYLKIVSKLVNISVDVLRKDLVKNENQTFSNSIKTTNQQEELVSRKEATTKAIIFVLSSIIHKKDYAEKALDMNLTFKNSNYQNLYDFAVKCKKNNKTYTISSLFDYFDVENNNDIKEVIDFNFETFQVSPQQYFEECLTKMNSLTLKQRQEQLVNQFKQETDLTKRREIANKLQELTKEIKNKMEKNPNV